jgi:hypothetical protein
MKEATMTEIETVDETVYFNTVEDITNLIEKCSFLSDSIGSLILLEMQPQKLVKKGERENLLYFADYPGELPRLISEYTAGRIFHEEFELRWEKINSKLQVVYIGRKRPVPLLIEQPDILKDCVRPTSSYYLFGKRLDDKAVERIGEPAQRGDFAEVRIPRLLRYPVKDEHMNYVKLDVYEYRHKITNERILFRFRKLLEVLE